MHPVVLDFSWVEFVETFNRFDIKNRKVKVRMDDQFSHVTEIMEINQLEETSISSVTIYFHGNLRNI